MRLVQEKLLDTLVSRAQEQVQVDKLQMAEVTLWTLHMYSYGV